MCNQLNSLKIGDLNDILNLLNDSAIQSKLNKDCLLDIDQKLSTITIRIQGDGYRALIPGEQLRTLWQLQESLYRLAAKVLHESSDIRTLSAEERALFEFRVGVSEGSLISDILIDDFWKALFDKSVGKMTGTQLTAVLVAGILVYGGFCAWDSHTKSLVAIEQAKSAQAVKDIVDSFNKRVFD